MTRAEGPLSLAHWISLRRRRSFEAVVVYAKKRLSFRMTNASHSALAFGVLLLLAAGGVGANFATSYVVLTPEARGLMIPNVSGPIRAKVASNVVMSLLFTLNAGTGYAAGPVTATTNAKGQVFRIAKLRQWCTFTYTAGAVLTVACTSSRRELEGGDTPNNNQGEIEDGISFDLEQGEEEGGGVNAHRRLATCSSCIVLVTASFTKRIKAVCGTALARKIPATFPWAKSAAAALCGMAAKLGKPASLAYKTCRCSCLDNVECPSSVCSRGICLEQKLAAGQKCYDFDNDDCLNGSCARGSYPSGESICCLSGKYTYSGDQAAYYCTGIQEVRSACDSLANEMCKSGVCSEGVCLEKQLEPTVACPDFEDGDCSTGACARSSYPLGGPICCLGGTYTYSYAQSTFYCNGIQDVGSPCDPRANEICASGVCYNETCIGGKLQEGVLCPDFDDNDCLSGMCARGTYPSGEPVCCSSGKVYSPSQFAVYCTGIQGRDSECDENELCSSGVCSGGVCVEQKLGNGVHCPDHEDYDCANARCARGAYPSGDLVCCPSDNYVHSPTSDALYCTGIQGIGSFCDSNEICSSGVCSGGLCIAAT
jgi:hypothetical protein